MWVYIIERKIRMNLIDKVNAKSVRNDIPEFRVGDTVRVDYQIKEGKNTRIQAFEGLVVAIKGGSIGKTFTVRKISFGIGVERTFPIHSPRIDHIEVKRRGKVRRAKLYYLRDLTGKSARVKEDIKARSVKEE